MGDRSPGRAGARSAPPRAPTGRRYDIAAFVRKMERLYTLLHDMSRATRRKGVLQRGSVVPDLRVVRVTAPSRRGRRDCRSACCCSRVRCLDRFPEGRAGLQGDEATYYSLAHSLARDGDFTFERKDLVRVWDEFPGGPEGIFLKRGKTIRLQRSRSVPVRPRVKRNDPVRTRLYYGKSFIYPLVAAPFVFVSGTNGFLVLHALLLALDLFVVYLFITARGSPPWRRPPTPCVPARLGRAGVLRLAHA